MEIPIFTVDAFTNVPFKGNPAAVCLIENELRGDLYQSIAAEMNLSETAFIIKRDSVDFSSGARFGLRWFTYKSEVPLCGHATLASAAVLFYLKKNVNPVLVFKTMSGELYVRQDEESLIIDFPLNTPNPQDQHEIKDLLKAAVGDLPIHEVCYSPATKYLMVRLADTCDRSQLVSLRPEAETLVSNETTGKIKCLIVTLKGAESTQSGYDFYSRVFTPWVGVTEDPVTAYQCSRRGGEVKMELRNDGRVDIIGQDQHEIKDLLKAAVGDLPIHEVCYSPTTKKLMVRLADTCNRSQLVSLKPEAETLLSNETTGKIKSLIITLKGVETTQSGYDFYSRVFAPWVGITEDPVTAYQCSRRGGEVKMELRNDGRLDIIGQVQIILQGTLKM
ncbi:phenazine biosynthesis-like domain-containing [Labeo rohita]|uniref:Phenazine biosynthesis-like domain-containing n=1 Tax=Labeo rohita TaxID=84645 RepID=A0A498N4R3_LABRO|nr:phenazine biosynthesis-like domain-containing [Labeo rohita]